jgi:hypothetical protein
MWWGLENLVLFLTDWIGPYFRLQSSDYDYDFILDRSSDFNDSRYHSTYFYPWRVVYPNNLDSRQWNQVRLGALHRRQRIPVRLGPLDEGYQTRLG